MAVISSSSPIDKPLVNLSSFPFYAPTRRPDPTIPSRPITIKKPSDDAKNPDSAAAAKKMCLCSPSKHPGAFRCARHRSATRVPATSQSTTSSSSSSASYNSSVRLSYRRLAMMNSLLKIGVEGEAVKRATWAPVRPSSAYCSQRRREEFKPKPSRLSLMSKTVSFD